MAHFRLARDVQRLLALAHVDMKLVLHRVVVSRYSFWLGRIGRLQVQPPC